MADSLSTNSDSPNVQNAVEAMTDRLVNAGAIAFLHGQAAAEHWLATGELPPKDGGS